VSGELYVSVDVEASGPVVGRHSMLAIGACITTDVQHRFHRILKPISDEAEPGAMKIVGKPLAAFNEHGIAPALVCDELRDWLVHEAGSKQPVFVGFNAAFDWGFVNWYLLTYLGSNPFGIAPLDIKSYFAGLTGVDWGGTRSSKIPGRYKPISRHTHDPLEDAIEQAAMFERMRAEPRLQQ
jgi:ribonuclease T